MSTTGKPVRIHRTRRTRPRVRPVTQQEYDDLRDCCCHKLGKTRPHLAIACRDLDQTA